MDDEVKKTADDEVENTTHDEVDDKVEKLIAELRQMASRYSGDGVGVHEVWRDWKMDPGVQLRLKRLKVYGVSLDDVQRRIFPRL